MSDPLPIPFEYRALIGLLRCAVSRRPPDSGLLAETDWASVLRQARQHGVDTFLYPWLAEHVPALFSARAEASSDSAPAAWRSLFLEAVTRTVLRQRQLAELLATFAQARIEVVPLKGAWLSETIYDDPAQRSMSDLDLLVRENDCDRSHALVLACGYSVRRDVRHNAYASDQSYYPAGHPCVLELHWNVSSEMDSATRKPDLTDIWRRTAKGSLLGQPVQTLAPEDQLAHLAQHVLHHLFAVPLRSYLDIALFLKRAGESLTAAHVEEASARWRTGLAVPFIASFCSDLFDVRIPPLFPKRAGEEDQRSQLCRALFNLPAAKQREGEQTLLRLTQATLLGRVRLVLSRVFMPASFLAIRHPSARHFYGLPFAWVSRAVYLIRRHSKSVRACLSNGVSRPQALETVASRESLARWLLGESKKKPE